MTDIVSIEVDGELGEPRFEASHDRPPWGMPAAIVVVGVLVLAVAWTALRSGGASSAPSATSAVTTPTTAQSAGPAADGLAVRGSTPVAAAQPATMVPRHDMRDPVAATRVALSAWGEFAVSGDMTAVRLSFAADGPQLAQLEDEAARVAAAPTSSGAYLVTLTDPRQEVGSGIATVTATVTWSRNGESDQTYLWAIELRQLQDQTWRLFTVRSLEA